MKFDIDDPKNHGRPQHFDIEHYLDSVEQMIMADEIQFALKMLENLPGWYRDNYPVRAIKIKQRLMKSLMFITDYASDESECVIDKSKVEDKILTIFCQPRGELIVKIIKQYNDQNLSPHIIEMGPADYWLPAGLQKADLKFSYKDITINKAAQEAAYASILDNTKHEPDPNSPHVFCAFEVIEHMWNPDEIAYHVYKLDKIPDIIMVSTPKYCLGGGLGNWDSRELGHIRTWTPNELVNWAIRNFPQYSWTIVDYHMQVIIGSLRQPE